MDVHHLRRLGTILFNWSRTGGTLNRPTNQKWAMTFLSVDYQSRKLKTLQSRGLLQGLIKQRQIEFGCDISTGQYQSSSGITNLQK